MVANPTQPYLSVSPDKVVTVSFTVPTDAQDANDVLAATQEIAEVARVPGGTVVLQSLVVTDTDDQGIAMDIVFFNADTALGTEDAAPDIDDTEVLSVIGRVAVDAGDYVDLGGSRVAVKSGLGLLMQVEDDTYSLWAALITRGTPTYASGAIQVQLGFIRN